MQPLYSDRIRCLKLFGSANHITQERCFALIVMPMASQAFPNRSWQSLQFCFNQRGQVIAFDAIFFQQGPSNEKERDDIMGCIEALKHAHDANQLDCCYDAQRQQIHVRNLPSNDQNFLTNLLIKLSVLLQIEQAFCVEIHPLLIDQTLLADEYQRLQSSTPNIKNQRPESVRSVMDATQQCIIM